MHTFTTIIVFIIMAITHSPDNGATTFTVETAVQVPSYEECQVMVETFNQAAAEDAINKNPKAKIVALEYEGFCSTLITGWKDAVQAEK